ncbi:MAG: hypothetical protein ACD_79C01061G0002 [uncultured bacterium]|nr:MAG: hypothetical protein ACD_79C01061G0002 [uncultured bacterium]
MYRDFKFEISGTDKINESMKEPPKTQAMAYLREGFERQVSLYEKILAMSKWENEVLSKSKDLGKVFENIPKKLALINEATALDDALKEEKEKLMQDKALQIPVPEEIVVLLKSIEVLLEEIITLDDNNRELLVTIQRLELLEKKVRIPNNAVTAAQTYKSNA